VRLWSLHPKHLDAKGLVALWREGLLAQAVLRGRTKGYRRHPQLERFRASDAPVARIAQYLRVVADEATARGYRFDASKIARTSRPRGTLTVTRGQLRHEREHLAAKLARRDPRRLAALPAVLEPHPMFRVVAGGVEPWERVAR
jgi:hypothetical protein